MSALQISLIILALLVSGGLAVYSWWQERKYRKQWMATFGRSAQAVGDIEPTEDDFADIDGHPQPVVRQHEPVEDDAYRPVKPAPVQEVHFVTEPETIAVGEIEPTDFSAPALEKLEEIVGLAHVMPSVEQIMDNRDLPAPPIDELLEYAIHIDSAHPLPGTAFTTLIESQRGEGKHVRWLGYAESQEKWVEISPWRNQAFHHAVAAVQLADRQGAVTANVLEQLCDDLQTFAAQYHGRVECDAVDAAAARAARLDRFCVDVDVLIGLNIVAPNERMFAGALIEQAANDAGMQLDGTGVYQRRNERGDILYSLCNHDDVPFIAGQMAYLTTSGVTLLFEVPRIENGVAVFADMARLALQLADRLDGQLVDDTGRILTGPGLEKIQGQLVQIYQQMEAGHVPPGGRRAQRLFN